jgi:hypothetical protein
VRAPGLGWVKTNHVPARPVLPCAEGMILTIMMSTTMRAPQAHPSRLALRQRYAMSMGVCVCRGARGLSCGEAA